MYPLKLSTKPITITLIFQNWDQRDAFCIRVIGLIQSVLSPETAKIFCEGLDDVVTALMARSGLPRGPGAARGNLMSSKNFSSQE